MEAQWTPHRTGIGSLAFGGPSLWIRDVDSTIRAVVRDALITRAAPDAAAWFAMIPSRGDGWQTLEHRIDWIWQADTLRRVDTD